MRPIHPITGTRLGISPDRVSGGEPVSSPAEFYGVANWGRNEINIDVNRYNRFNRSNITNGRWSTMSPIGKACRTPTDVSTISSAVRIKGTSRQVGNSSVVAPKRVAQLWLVRRQVLRVVQSRGKRSASVRRSCLRERPGQSPEQRPLTERGRAETRELPARAGAQAERLQSIAGVVASVVAADFVGVAAAEAVGVAAVGRRSDIRVKHDIVLLGRLSNGMGLYRFAYDGSQKLYAGVIAQEAMKVIPQAVSRDQARLSESRLRASSGVPFQTYNHWLAAGARMPKLNPN